VVLDDVSRQAQHSVPKPLKLGIPAAISRLTTDMTTAVNLNDQLDLRGDEVADEEPCDWHLTAKLHTQCATPNGGPEPTLRDSGTVPEPELVLSELSLATSLAA